MRLWRASPQRRFKEGSLSPGLRKFAYMKTLEQMMIMMVSLVITTVAVKYALPQMYEEGFAQLQMVVDTLNQMKQGYIPPA